MEFNQVRYFLAILKEGSFTQAAKRCGISQPSISIAIKLLEKKLGGTLFERDQKKITLTAFGNVMRPYFEDLNRCAKVVAKQAARHQSVKAMGKKE